MNEKQLFAEYLFKNVVPKLADGIITRRNFVKSALQFRNTTTMCHGVHGLADGTIRLLLQEKKIERIDIGEYKVIL